MVFRRGCSAAPLTSSPWYPVAVDHSIRTLGGFRADTASAGAHALDGRRIDCTTMIRFAPTRIIDIAPLFSGGAAATDRAVTEALSDHGSFVATGFAGAEGFGGRIADLLSFFSMEQAHKLVCATCRHVPRNPNIYRGFYPLPEKPHWSPNEIFDIGPEPAMTSPDVPGAESFRESNVLCGEIRRLFRNEVRECFLAMYQRHLRAPADSHAPALHRGAVVQLPDRLPAHGV